jgi:peptide/nickel transport system substrate-binding protein
LLAAAMLATGASLIGSAQLAGAAPERRGGIFKVGTSGASVEIDPQVAYITTSWWMQYATAAKLYNYTPGAKLVPEVASGFRVSNGGKRYTFTLRKGFRFSDGSAVRGRNFKYAFDRSANRDLASPAAQFIIDPGGTEIVGARAVNQGRARSVSGVQVRGNRLIINLTRPDAQFVSKLTLPFFQATSTRLPLNREVVTVRSSSDIPSAGPYVFTWNEVNRLTQLRRNPYWKPGPGRTAPRNLDGVDVSWNLNEQVAYELVERGELDQGPIPPSEIEGVASRYGVNRSRFWSMPANCTGQLPLNMANALFRGNPRLRRAINYAVDRRAYGALAGPFASRPWSRLLSPNVLGSRPQQPYPPSPDLVRARTLAEGRFRTGKITVYYRSSGTTNLEQAQLVRQNLINLGFQPDNMTMRGFSGGQIYTAMSRRGTDADIGVSMGWCSDLPDPADLERGLAFSQMDLPLWRKKLDAASRLVGRARLEAYRRLDLSIMQHVAPVAVMRTFNNRYFFSDRVDPRSLRYHSAYQDWSIPALALK